jgi:hypothetical protein
MVKVQDDAHVPSSLHYALTDSQCNKCGEYLKWEANFENINSPKYTAKHCNLNYMITIDSVKVQLVDKFVGRDVAEADLKTQTTTNTKTNLVEGEENELHEGEKQQQPNALRLAELLKDKEMREKKAKLGDGRNISAEDR